MAVHIRLKQFDGPLDLLLHLIGKAKIDLKDVFVSEITEQYIEAVQSAPDFDMDEASEFVAMAALLLEIKSRSLLPKPPKEDEEDPEQLLLQRLIAYKQFKGAAAALGARMQAESRMHPRVAGPDPEFLGLMPDYLAGITLRGLAVICADLDGKRQTFLLEAEHVAPHRVPLDLTVASVDRFTMAHQTCTFRELLDGDATTEQLVVTFLAMLELAKRGSLTLSQDEIFGTICINRVEGAEAYVPGEGPDLTE